MTEKTKKKPPKGGRKGGKRFPRISLEASVDYANKLVSKTHTSAQPEDIVFPGVFNATGPTAQVRASALRQFGLLDGKKDAIKSTELARSISAAPEDEQKPLVATACLKPNIYKVIFDTFRADTVSFARVRQQAANQGIHPDLLDEFTSLCLESFEHAGLVSETNGEYVFAGDTSAAAASESDDDPEVEDTEEETDDSDDDQPTDNGEDDNGVQPPTPGLVVNVTVALDSTLDTEKLERQLEILRNYGLVKGPKRK